MCIPCAICCVVLGASRAPFVRHLLLCLSCSIPTSRAPFADFPCAVRPFPVRHSSVSRAPSHGHPSRAPFGPPPVRHLYAAYVSRAPSVRPN